ncbi:MAG: hypothetical protein AABN33_12795 [Acidobacteriota bacterium]
MMSKLEKEIRFLKVYAVVTTLLFGVLVFSAFQQANQKTKFTEIDVERINIIEKDGKLKMVISNSERQHPGIVDGKTLSRKRPPGMLFFNEKGDECGGLGFDGNQKDGKANAGALLAFDRFRQDQTVGIQYGEANGQYFAGLRVWDRPDTSLGPVIEKLVAIEKMSEGPEKTAAMKELREMPGGAERVMVGRDREQAAVVRLSDANGKPRIKLSVDVAGLPKLEFLDETGKVTYSLPQYGKADKK